MTCGAMACGFQSNTAIALWLESWTTNSTLQYAFCIVGLFLMGVLLEYVRFLNVVYTREYLVRASEHASWSSSKRFGRKLVRALLHFVHLTIGYLLMLAVMTYNVGVFCSVLGGFGVGFFLFAEDHLPEDKKQQQETTSLIDPASCH